MSVRMLTSNNPLCDLPNIRISKGIEENRSSCNEKMTSFVHNVNVHCSYAVEFTV